jgi:L-rhamnose-H+ transport protein
MHPNPLLGVVLHWIGGLAAASFYIPYRGVRRWAWESYWIVGGFFAWIVAPWVICLLLVPDTFEILRAAPQGPVLWAVFFGVLWGVGGITYGLTMRYLGVGLGIAVALGSCALFGTLLPPIFNGQIGEVLGTHSGQIVLLGIAVCAAGIALSGLAGFSKERELSEEERAEVVEEYNLPRGIMTAVLCGMMSACFAFGLSAGKPIADITKARLLDAGRGDLWQNLPVLVVVLIGGFATNLLWCLGLNLRNRTLGDYVGRSGSAGAVLANYLLCALAGLTWYMQFFFYSMAQTKMGPFEFSSWTLHMASIIIFGTLWGLALREWRGTGPRTRTLLVAGLLVLVASTVVVGYGNYIKSADTARAAEAPPAPRPEDALDAGRVREIAASLQEKPSGVGRPITDRPAWAKLAKADRYRDFNRQAEEIAGRAIPPQPDELYLDFSRTGNRANWESVAFQRRRNVGVLVLAECLEDRGRFLAKIREYIDALCAERTWVWAGHDPKLANFNGESTDIDLGAAELAWQMATARWLLADRLPADARNAIAENLTRRIVEPYLAAASGRTKPFPWMTRTTNWNAVCHAGVIGATLATAEDRDTRARVVALAERDVQHFLDGFGADGYCFEGLGYWNYGFGHYVLLAETIRQATGGRLDLIARPGVRAIATFGPRIQITNGIAPAFADCDINATPAPQIMRYVNARFGLGLSGYELPDVSSERSYLYERAVHDFLDPAALPKAGGADAADSPLRSWFASAGVLVARPAPGSGCRIGVALKGGHNAETHNHNDLGSYTVVIDGQSVLLDPGREHYTARTFSPRRYDSKLLNSYGHPVPLVAGQLQRNGKHAAARIVRADFTASTDTVVMDVTSAYDVPGLKRLERTFVYERSGTGSLTVTDRVEFDKPQSFGTALITLGRLTKRDGKRLFITGPAGAEAVVEVDAGPAGYVVDVNEIRENAPVTPTRIGVNLVDKTASASISIRIAPPAR